MRRGKTPWRTANMSTPFAVPITARPKVEAIANGFPFRICRSATSKLRRHWHTQSFASEVFFGPFGRFGFLRGFFVVALLGLACMVLFLNGSSLRLGHEQP